MDITCPCCGYKSLSEIGTYEICPICYWEDDPYNRINPDKIGSNHVTLFDGQRNYTLYRACCVEMIKNTRLPFEDEIRDPFWRANE